MAKGEAVAVSAEQAADLAALEAAAAEDLAAEDVAEQAAPARGADDVAEQLADAIKLVAHSALELSGAVEAGAVRTVAVFSDQECRKVGGLLAPVAIKYGWSIDALFGKWGPEMMAAVGLFGMYRKATMAWRADMAEIAAKAKEEAEKNAATAPG